MEACTSREWNLASRPTSISFVYRNKDENKYTLSTPALPVIESVPDWVITRNLYHPVHYTDIEAVVATAVEVVLI